MTSYMLGGDASVRHVESEDTIRKMESQLAGVDFSARQAEARRIREVRQGTFDHLVDRALQAKFHADTYDELRLNVGIHTPHRVLNDIVAKAVTEVSEGASYSLVRDGAEVESPEFQRFLEKFQPTPLMSEIAILRFLHRGVLAHPTIIRNPATGAREFRVCIYSPENYNIVVGRHPAQIKEIHLYWDEADGAGRKVDVRQRWTIDGWAEETRRENRTQWEPRDSGENLFGCLPFEHFTLQAPLTSVWSDCYGPLLADTTIAANVAETMIQNWSASQVKILAGEFRSFPDGQVLAHGRPVNVGDAENINVLDFTLDLGSFDSAMIKRLRDRAAVTCGLNVNEFEGVSEQASGQALRMRYWDRDRQALARRQSLVDGMVRLYWLSLRVLFVAMHEDAEPVDGFPRGVADLPPYDVKQTKDEAGNVVAEEPLALYEQPVRFAINVRETQYPELETERQAREEYELAKGFVSREELLMSRDHDVDATEARTRIETNLREEGRRGDKSMLALGGMIARRPVAGGGGGAGGGAKP